MSHIFVRSGGICLWLGSQSSLIFPAIFLHWLGLRKWAPENGVGPRPSLSQKFFLLPFILQVPEHATSCKGVRTSHSLYSCFSPFKFQPYWIFWSHLSVTFSTVIYSYFSQLLVTMILPTNSAIFSLPIEAFPFYSLKMVWHWDTK